VSQSRFQQSDALAEESSRRRDGKSALDEMFVRSMAYRRSKSYLEMMKFIAKFPLYRPFNRFILYIQNPNVTFVATPEQWEKRFERKVKPDARPLVILVPFGPVSFVYDLVDTEGKSLPEYLADPFSVVGKLSQRIWDFTLNNCPRDGIAVVKAEHSALKAGEIARYDSEIHAESVVGAGFRIEYVVALNEKFDLATHYATLAHELGHLYCGHLGGSQAGEWKSRVDLSKEVIEVEAESVAYLVCSRLGLETKSEKYIAYYAQTHDTMPVISLETVLKVAGRIEEMGERKLPPRKKAPPSNAL
jgi:hypothetical protein